jgi:hypothetical protein
MEGLLALRRTASPQSPYRTTAISRGENARLRRGGASRMAVSAWDARMCSAKTPRNRGDFSGRARVRAGSLCNSRLVGGAGSPARTRLSTPNSLIYGKIQGIRADSGSAGLATGPDSLACTRTCAPRSLEPGTGNFVPRSRDSRGLDPLRKVPDLTPVFRAAATPLEFHVARERFVWIGFFGLAAASGRFESNAFKKLPQE